jgi:hypothetical protein
MKGDTIPDQHHIARLCRPKCISPDEKIQASAFMVRVGEESLSVNWLEFLKSSSRENEIAELQNIYSKKFNKVEVRAQIAVLNVGEVREKVLAESPDRRNLKVFHNPEVNDPSHSGIYNLRHDDEIIITELILESVQETCTARK